METQFKKRVLELAKGHSMVKDALMQLHPEAFKSKDWHDIKTYEDAEEALPVAEEDKLRDTDSPYIIALKKLLHIRRAMCPDFKVDWTNSNQRKWRPWFNLSSGFGFDDSVYGFTDAHTDCGSRLCLPTEEISDYFGKQFIDLHEILITYQI